MNANRLSIKGPEDILGYIPHSLGYWPKDSLVAMTMQGKRLGATLRVDLPHCEHPPELRYFSTHVRNYLQADDDADGVLLAFFTNEGWGHSEPGPAPVRFGLNVILQSLEATLGAAGMPVRDAWFVGDTHWRNAYCTDTSCCPVPGRSVNDIRDSRLNAEMVYLGSSVGAPPGEAPRPAAAAPPADLQVVAAEHRWSAALEGQRRSREQFELVLRVFEQELQREAEQQSPEVAGYLRAALLVPSWRDAVLVLAAAGHAAALKGAEDFGMFDHESSSQAVAPFEVAEDVAAVADCGDAGLAASYGEVLLGLAPAVPDWTSMGKLEHLLRRVGDSGGGEARAAALTGRGWIEWCRGRGSFAHDLLEQALEEYPGYRLAELLSELVRRGTLCGWAGRRAAAWQKFAPDAA